MWLFLVFSASLSKMIPWKPFPSSETMQVCPLPEFAINTCFEMFCCLYFLPAFHHPINCPPHASKSWIHLSESLQICLPHLSFCISVFSALVCHFFFGMSLFYFFINPSTKFLYHHPKCFFFHFHAFVPHFKRTSKWVFSAQHALKTMSLNVTNVFSSLQSPTDD